MSQGVIKIALAMAFAALLPSCFGAQVNTRPIGPVALAYNFPKPTPTETPQPQPSLTVGQVSPGQGAVEVRGFHEPPDTVSYAETPSPLAGYRGPDFQTISVKALWVAMQAYLREFPQDPMNVISLAGGATDGTTQSRRRSRCNPARADRRW